jgi:Domain of unknown function (DUF397)
LRPAFIFLVCKIIPASRLTIDIVGVAKIWAYDNGGRRQHAGSAGAVVSVSQGITMLRVRPPVSRLSWRKSSYSLAQGECVEVAAISDGIAARDSTDKCGTLLLYLATDWRAFIATIKQQ